MESRAILRFSGVSARKMRQVADLVRGKDVDVALHSLKFVTKTSARPLEKLITSAVANAREKATAADQRFDADSFYVKTVMVDEGPTAKRFRPRAQGRAYQIRKRSCHVDVVLCERVGKTAKRRPPASAAKAAPARGDKKSGAGSEKSKSAAKGGEKKSGAKRDKKQKAAAAAK